VTRHVAFLAQLYRVWGAVFGIVGAAGLALAGGAWAIARTGGPVSTGSSVAAGVTAVTMGVLAVTALVWAALHVWVGSALKRHGPRARLLALGLAVGNLPLLPFGTALGAYACWVLLQEDGRQVFVAPRPHSSG
jgi:cytochrome bd-type quinol oxidase subunit 2